MAEGRMTFVGFGDLRDEYTMTYYTVLSFTIQSSIICISHFLVKLQPPHLGRASVLGIGLYGGHYIGVLYRDNGNEKGNYQNYWDYIGVQKASFLLCRGDEKERTC